GRPLWLSSAAALKSSRSSPTKSPPTSPTGPSKGYARPPPPPPSMREKRPLWPIEADSRDCRAPVSAGPAHPRRSAPVPLPERRPMPHLDTGNTGFMLLCTSLVMLMTPGLAFFYGGLVGRKNVLAIMMQSFVSMGWTTVIWFAVGYSLCFSGDTAGVIGNLGQAFLHAVRL